MDCSVAKEACSLGLAPTTSTTAMLALGDALALLIALMLTGMPISISLGLTVLTFLFTMTEVPIESVGLKLFSGLDNFGIMAIPFFILAGNFLTHGGVAKRMIAFATSIIGHFHGGLLRHQPALLRRRNEAVVFAQFVFICYSQNNKNFIVIVLLKLCGAHIIKSIF